MKAKKPLNQSLLSGLCLAGLLLAGCGSEPESSVDASGPSGPRIPVLDTMPEATLTVREARRQLKPGDEAAVRGQIGGVEEPFYEGYAGFVLADSELVFCNEMPGDDHCETPWDACCEDLDKRKASRIGVELVGADGMPLGFGLKGVSGLEGLTEVVVTGKVADSSSADNLIVHADGFYLVK